MLLSWLTQICNCCLRLTLTRPWTDFLSRSTATVCGIVVSTPTVLFWCPWNHTGIHLSCTLLACDKNRMSSHIWVNEKSNWFECDCAYLFSYPSTAVLKVYARTVLVLYGVRNGGLAPVAGSRPLKTRSTKQRPLGPGGNTAAVLMLVEEESLHLCPLTRCGDTDFSQNTWK